MCKHGQEKIVYVKVPFDLSAEGKDIYKPKKIDACIADIVQALQDGGMDMRGCCCGHDKTLGNIHLQDGRVLLILNQDQGKKYMSVDVGDWPKLLNEWFRE